MSSCRIVAVEIWTWKWAKISNHTWEISFALVETLNKCLLKIYKRLTSILLYFPKNCNNYQNRYFTVVLLFQGIWTHDVIHGVPKLNPNLNMTSFMYYVTAQERENYFNCTTFGFCCKMLYVRKIFRLGFSCIGLHSSSKMTGMIDIMGGLEAPYLLSFISN